MFDLHKELNKFFQDHVRLGKKRRDSLAKVRDANLDRLRNGLDALGERDNVVYAYFKEARTRCRYELVRSSCRSAESEAVPAGSGRR
jgi:hypothetical protein